MQVLAVDLELVDADVHERKYGRDLGEVGREQQPHHDFVLLRLVNHVGDQLDEHYFFAPGVEFPVYRFLDFDFLAGVLLDDGYVFLNYIFGAQRVEGEVVGAREMPALVHLQPDFFFVALHEHYND